MAEPPATMIPFVERMPRPPMVEKHRSMSWITDRLAGIPQRGTPLWWSCAVALVGSLASFGVFCILYLLFTGVGVWGNNIRWPGLGVSPTLCFGSGLVTPAH
jgi:hypothetical protein